MEFGADSMLNFLSGLSAFLLFLSVSLTLVAVSGVISFLLPIISLIGFIFSFTIALREKSKLGNVYRRNIKEIFDLLPHEREKAIEKVKHLLQGLLEKKRFLTVVTLFNLLSYSRIWDEALQIFQETIMELPDPPLDELVSTFLTEFKTEQKNRERSFFSRLSTIIKQRVHTNRPKIEKKIQKRLKMLRERQTREV